MDSGLHLCFVGSHVSFAPEKKLPPSSLLSATFYESPMTFAQVGQGRLGSSELRRAALCWLYLEGLLYLVKCPRLWVPRGEVLQGSWWWQWGFVLLWGFCGVFVKVSFHSGSL